MEKKKRRGAYVPRVNLEFVCHGELSLKVENSVVCVRFDECADKKWRLLLKEKRIIINNKELIKLVKCGLLRGPLGLLHLSLPWLGSESWTKHRCLPPSLFRRVGSTRRVPLISLQSHLNGVLMQCSSLNLPVIRIIGLRLSNYVHLPLLFSETFTYYYYYCYNDDNDSNDSLLLHLHFRYLSALGAVVSSLRI